MFEIIKEQFTGKLINPEDPAPPQAKRLNA